MDKTLNGAIPVSDSILLRLLEQNPKLGPYLYGPREPSYCSTTEPIGKSSAHRRVVSHR
jgi:hypothetical protein